MRLARSELFHIGKHCSAASAPFPAWGISISLLYAAIHASQHLHASQHYPLAGLFWTVAVMRYDSVVMSHYIGCVYSIQQGSGVCTSVSLGFTCHWCGLSALLSKGDILAGMNSNPGWSDRGPDLDEWLVAVWCCGSVVDWTNKVPLLWTRSLSEWIFGWANHL